MFFCTLFYRLRYLPEHVTSTHGHQSPCCLRLSSSSDVCLQPSCFSPLFAADCVSGPAALWPAPGLCDPQQLFLLLLQPGSTTLQRLIAHGLQMQGHPAFHAAPPSVALVPCFPDEAFNCLVHVADKHGTPAQQFRGEAPHPDPLWWWRSKRITLFFSGGIFCCAAPGEAHSGKPATEAGSPLPRCKQSQEHRLKHGPRQR